MYFCSFFLAPAFTTDLDGGGGGEGGGEGGGGGETLNFSFSRSSLPLLVYFLHFFGFFSSFLFHLAGASRFADVSSFVLPSSFLWCVCVCGLTSGDGWDESERVGVANKWRAQNQSMYTNQSVGLRRTLRRRAHWHNQSRRFFSHFCWIFVSSFSKSDVGIESERLRSAPFPSSWQKKKNNKKKGIGRRRCRLEVVGRWKDDDNEKKIESCSLKIRNTDGWKSNAKLAPTSRSSPT